MTSCHEAPNLPARNCDGFCAWKDSGNILDKCVVTGCLNTPNAEKEIALHKIPFFGDRSEVKARRKKWTDFLKLKHAKWTATASSAVTLLPKTLPHGIILAASNSSEHSKMRLVSFQY